MRYIRVLWNHDLADEPVVIYSAIDSTGREVRKVERYRDGRMDLASDDTRTGTTVLSESPMPSLDEINAQDEFEGEDISESEFDEVFNRAWAWFADDND